MTEAHLSQERPKTEPRPRILYVIGELVDGGAERVFVNYVRHAQAVKPVVVLNNPDGRMFSQLPEDCLIEFLGRDDSPPPAAGSGRSFKAWLRDTPVGHYLGIAYQALRTLVYSWRVARIANRTGITVVSCFLMESHLVGLLAKLLFRKNLIILLNIHEHISGSVEYTYPTLLERLALRFVMRFLYPGADQVIVVSESMRTDLVERWKVDPEKIRVAYNPVDLEKICVAAQTENISMAPVSDSGEVTLAFLGRLVYLKGVHHLIEAMGHLKDRLPARALLIGEGDEHRSLLDQCRKLGLSEQVEFLGWQDNPWQILASADLLVQPSLTEAFPQSIVEAMALGIPVVASDCSPGIREILDNGKYGRLVPPADSAALADAIEELMADPDLRRTYGDLGRERIQKFFPENTVPVYERILLNAQRA